MARTARYVTSTGTDTYSNSTNPATPMSIATAKTNAAAGDDVWIKKDGTYDLSAGNWTPTNSGTIASPIRFIGYNSTIGDGYLGRSNGGALITTNMPVISLATRLIDAGSNPYVIFENLNISTSIAAFAVKCGNRGGFYRCAITNSANSASANGADLGGADAEAIENDITMSGSTTGYCIIASQTMTRIYGNRLTAPNGSLVKGSGGSFVAIANQLYSAVYAFDITVAASASCVIANNTGYALTDFIRLPNSVSAIGKPLLINNSVTDLSGRMLNSLYVGTGDLPSARWYNRTRDNGSSDQGSADWPVYGSVTTDTGSASSDFVNAAGGDFRLIATSPARAAGIPPFSEIGALQHQDISPAFRGGNQ